MELTATLHGRTGQTRRGRAGVDRGPHGSSAAEPRSVQPLGVVWVARVLVVATRTSWSPACTEAGTTTVANWCWRRSAAEARKAGAGEAASVTVTEAVSVSVAPSSSVTVSVTR